MFWKQFNMLNSKPMVAETELPALGSDVPRIVQLLGLCCMQGLVHVLILPTQFLT
jgi:hypothetical protein